MVNKWREEKEMQDLAYPLERVQRRRRPEAGGGETVTLQDAPMAHIRLALKNGAYSFRMPLRSTELSPGPSSLPP
jgi:hypothetical protein